MELLKPEELYKMAKFVIKKNGFPYDEDLIQDMVSKAYEKLTCGYYDENKSQQGTFVYMVMKQVYFNKVRKEKQLKKIPKYMIDSLDETFKVNDGDEISYVEVLEDKMTCFKKEKVKNEIMSEISHLINPITKLSLEGYTQNMIANMYNTSQTNINRAISKNKKIITEYLKNKGLYEYYHRQFVDVFFAD